MSFEAGSVIEVQMHYRVNGQQCMNVLHYEPGIVLPGTVWDSEKAVVDQITADIVTDNTWPWHWLRLLASNVTVNRVQCQQIYPNRYRAYYEDLTVLGGNPAPELCTTPNIQASVEKFGIMGTRHDIGAIHIAGLPSSAYTNGLLTVAYQGLLENFAQEWKEPYAVAAGSIIPVIIKKKKVVVEGKPKWEIDGATQLFGVDIKDEVRTMRRRTVGLGI